MSSLANVMNHPSSEMFLYYQNATFRARTCTILFAVFPALQTGTVCTHGSQVQTPMIWQGLGWYTVCGTAKSHCLHVPHIWIKCHDPHSLLSSTGPVTPKLTNVHLRFYFLKFSLFLNKHRGEKIKLKMACSLNSDKGFPRPEVMRFYLVTLLITPTNWCWRQDSESCLCLT